MIRRINNKQIAAAVNDFGAELMSIRDLEGTEYIWQGNPDVWPSRAPILFPVVGNLKDARYTYEGKEYELGRHGFARKMDFELVEEDGDRLVFRLLPTDDTRKSYPFEFEFLVKYQLEGTSLGVTFEVTNNGDVVMPFTLGGHPGFSLEWGDDDQIEDYYLEFEQEETLDSMFLNDERLLGDESERVLEGEKVLRLRKDLFDHDALILLDFKSDKVTLKSDRYDRSLTVEFPGFPFLGIWAKPAAPYVCIEPWYGHVDPAGHDGDIMKKPGMMFLEPNQSFSCTHTIVISS
ncbi:hypothetical protein BVX97_02275 [bacterium E08(2017)]|nr:hypothetical protein BVX97_02275 [bacterium E08(2017)]